MSGILRRGLPEQLACIVEGATADWKIKQIWQRAALMCAFMVTGAVDLIALDKSATLVSSMRGNDP
jgi:hypothetical protein